jgi:2-oxoglutarate ferredoxin oxidoreductase subunit alpha
MNTAEILGKFEKRLVCEINLGQFASYLRMNHPEFLYRQFNKIMGLPFTVKDLKEAILKNLED